MEANPGIACGFHKGSKKTLAFSVKKKFLENIRDWAVYLVYQYFYGRAS